jgi:uncharacterized membrane protein
VIPRAALAPALMQVAPLLLLATAAMALRLSGYPAAAALLGLGGVAAYAGRRLGWLARLALLAAFGGLVLGLWLHPAAMWLLVRLLPVLGILLMAVHFGMTLLPGREPLITRYTRYDHGVRLDECAGYTRGLTWLWTGVFLALAPLYLVALLGWPPFHGAVDLPEVVGASSAFMLLLFLGEHVVRTLRFPHFGLATPARTARAVLAATMARYA